MKPPLLFLFLMISLKIQAQSKLSSGFFVNEIHAAGKINDKYEIEMFLHEDIQKNWVGWNTSAKPDSLIYEGTITYSKIYGSYNYTSKNKEIYIVGEKKSYSLKDDVVIDSLILNEFNKESGFSGQFKLKIKKGRISGFWLNSDKTKKMKVEASIDPNSYSTTVKVIKNNGVRVFLNFDPMSSSTLLYSKFYNKKDYFLFETSVPHCGVIKGFGQCCGGYDSYYNFVSVDSFGNIKFINNLLYYDCAPPNLYTISADYEKNLELFKLGKAKQLYFGNIKDKGKLILDSGALEKGIQILK